MSSESSSTSSKIRQFGLYRTIDQRTEEFLKLSRKRQIRQGCACAAVSTAITVTIVVILVLIYIFPGNIDRQKSTSTFNWPGLVNDTDTDIYNKAKTASINPAAVRLLPILIKILQNQQSPNELPKPQNETKWKEEKRNGYQQKHKKFAPDKEIKSHFAEKYTVNNKGKSLILYKRPIENTDYYAQMRKLKHYREIINYLNKMISRKAETRTLSSKTTDESNVDRIKTKQITTKAIKTNKLTNCSDMQVKNEKQITTTTNKSTNRSKSSGTNLKHTQECYYFRPANVDGLLIDLILNIKKLLTHYEKNKTVQPESKQLQTTTTESYISDEILTTNTDRPTSATSPKTTTENIFYIEPAQNIKFDQDKNKISFQLSSNMHGNYEYELQNISLWSTEVTTKKDTSTIKSYKESTQSSNYYDIFHSNLLNDTQLETTSLPETTDTIGPSELVEPTETNAHTDSINSARSKEEDSENTQSYIGTSMEHDRISFKNPGERDRLSSFPFRNQNASSTNENEQERSVNPITNIRSNFSVTSKPNHTSTQVTKYNKSERSKSTTSTEPSSASIFLRKMGKYITPLDKVALKKYQNKSWNAKDKSCENPPGDYDDHTTKSRDDKFAQYSDTKEDLESSEDSSYLRQHLGLVNKQSKVLNDNELGLRLVSALPQSKPVYMNILHKNWNSE